MTRAAAGDLDRRIEVQTAAPVTDQAGDVGEPVWTLAFKRWAACLPSQNSAGESQGAQLVVRQSDTVWRIRDDSEARMIAPESHRVIHKGRIFEIVGIEESRDRSDTLDLVCTSRPDLRGDRAPVAESG
jgi:head-tail adaptor